MPCALEESVWPKHPEEKIDRGIHSQVPHELGQDIFQLALCTPYNRDKTALLQKNSIMYIFLRLLSPTVHVF